MLCISVYTIADLHLSLSVGKEKEMDVFTQWQGYTEKLKQNWCEIVNSRDTVVVVGDLSWSMKLEESFEDFKFLNELPGKKILIKGNHDYWWSSKNKINNYLLENKFDTVSILHNSAQVVENLAICGTRGWLLEPKEEKDIKILNREVQRLEMSIKLGKKTGLEPVVFLHYPPIYGSVVCGKLMEVLVKNKIKKCYYGHLHGRISAEKARVGKYEGIMFNLVSADYVNFTPVLVE